MELTHEFTVPAAVETTWDAFTDIEGVAGCFPGAVVTSVEDDVFRGSCKVKLGPIALVYNGSGTFLEKDETAHTMTIQAKGKDKRGNGTAGADVLVTMTPGEGGTRVVVVTDLAITGKPAQFGRGVIQDVSDKLLAQFVDCLEARVGAADEPEPEPAESEPAEPAPTQARTAPEERSRADDALDLGAAVLPVLVKTYGKQLAGLGVLLLVIWLIRRRR